MDRESAPTFTLPSVYYRWLERVRKYPMFDIWQGGTLCAVRLTYILEPTEGERNVFLHRLRLRIDSPDEYLPLGYDLFGNLLAWNMREGGVYFFWHAEGFPAYRVAPSLEEMCNRLYYRPVSA